MTLSKKSNTFQPPSIFPKLLPWQRCLVHNNEANVHAISPIHLYPFSALPGKYCLLRHHYEPLQGYDSSDLDHLGKEPEVHTLFNKNPASLLYNTSFFEMES